MVQSQRNEKNKRVSFDEPDQERIKTLSLECVGKE
jgi:hypothetical protein